MRATYTDAAKQELERFLGHQKDTIESMILEKKAIFGDDFIEITASDIKEAGDRIRPIYMYPSKYRNASQLIITKLYVAAGILMMIGAFFYDDIHQLLTGNKTQSLLFLMGAFMVILGGVFNYWLKLRRQRLEERLDMMLDDVFKKNLTDDHR